MMQTYTWNFVLHTFWTVFFSSTVTLKSSLFTNEQVIDKKKRKKKTSVGQKTHNETQADV